MNGEMSDQRIKGPWSAEEDRILTRLVERYGARNWSLITRTWSAAPSRRRRTRRSWQRTRSTATGGPPLRGFCPDGPTTP
ncbi:transcription factor myb44 [Phtheirospermum japonicum]|uniref:Transcription factor myb44 n=1 Tax=Phtheirospermum japonicum TaxID=374723 RepID=A0A830CJF7_9LAMI|nr:transcription factor myb44 [Phtheirospermum japonicum]